VLVRALYDFTAMESDELSIQAGDVLYVKRGDENDQWLFGYIGECCGLIPASYVEVRLIAI